MAKGKEESKQHKKSFIWRSLRISFWVMIGSYVASLIFSDIDPNLSSLGLWIVLGIIQFIALVFTFIVSIIHLKKYEKKAFAIVALVLSSLLILFFLFGLLVGIIMGVNGVKVPLA